MVGTQKAEEVLLLRVAQNIGARRRALDLTQAQLAERLGVETETLSRFERGKHAPTLKNLVRLASLLQTTVADLLAEECQQPADEVTQVGAWLAVLSQEDRAFALHMLRQCCEHLEAKRLPRPQEEPMVTRGLDPEALRKALFCPVADLDSNIDNILALIAAGVVVTVTGEGGKQVRISADKAYVLYRLAPSLRAKVLAQFPDKEAFWDLQLGRSSYWDERPSSLLAPGNPKKGSRAMGKNVKKSSAARKKKVKQSDQDLKATIETVPDGDSQE